MTALTTELALTDDCQTGALAKHAAEHAETADGAVGFSDWKTQRGMRMRYGGCAHAHARPGAGHRPVV